MRARREVSLSVLCALLVACSAVASAPPGSHDPTIEGVGVLPGGSSPDPGSYVPADDATVPLSVSVAPTEPAPSTTLIPAVTIGSLVAGNKLLMIGDSITASVAERYGGELCKALVPLGWQVEVDAEPSRFIDFGNAVLDQRLGAKWDAAYVFLGTNYLGDQQSYLKQLERIVQRLSPIPVVLLTVTEFAENRRQVNDAITLVASEFPNVHLVDWGAIAAADAATVLLPDGHHLTNAGQTKLASTVAGFVGQAPVQPGRCLSTLFTNDAGLIVTDTTVAEQGGGQPPPTTVRPHTSSTVADTGTTTAVTISTSTVPSPTTATTQPSPSTQQSTAPTTTQPQR